MSKGRRAEKRKREKKRERKREREREERRVRENQKERESEKKKKTECVDVYLSVYFKFVCLFEHFTMHLLSFFSISISIFF